MAEEEAAMRVFVKAGCPWCVDAVAYLRGEGYIFKEIDVLQDAALLDEMIALCGQGLAPTLEIQGKVLPDFDVSELKVFLSRHGITPAMTQ